MGRDSRQEEQDGDNEDAALIIHGLIAPSALP
jgi:hypothetical protein